MYTALKMSLASPKFLAAPAVRWIHGKREGFGSSCLGGVCSPGRPWSNAVPLLPVPISFPHRSSLCSKKDICTYDTLLHVGCVPSVVLRGKRRNKKKRKKGEIGRKEKLFPVILYFWVSSSGLCFPGRGLAAPEREVGSWNCALCRGFLWLMWIKKGKTYEFAKAIHHSLCPGAVPSVCHCQLQGQVNAWGPSGGPGCVGSMGTLPTLQFSLAFGS